MSRKLSLLMGALCTTLIAPPALLAHEGGFDRALADDARLIQMLENRGKIPAGASDAAQQKALDNYLDKRMKDAAQAQGKPHPFAEKQHAYRQKILKKMQVSTDKGVHGDVSFMALEEPSRTDKVLAILIDFPDYPKNSIKPGQSEMYYPDYTSAHYQNLLFSPTGYVGPNGENLISMQQYYQQQSRGTYGVNGQVMGWYTAKKPAAYYGDNNNSTAVRELVREALTELAKDPEFDWSQFDQEDRYDYNNNGNYHEPDGMIDHLMIFHASIGEEAGGGDLGENAIWSHRWDLGEVFEIPGTSHDLGKWDGKYAALDYTIQPITAAAGVCAHEFAHDLGLPDEYDTSRNSIYGEPVSFWSIMSSGSWAGLIPGAEPVGFSGWARSFLQTSLGGKWQNRLDLDINDLNHQGTRVVLTEATSLTNHTNAVRINLPNKKAQLESPYGGEYHYHSDQGDDLDNRLIYEVALPEAQEITFSFKTNYKIELDYDYGLVLVNGQPIAGNITTEEDPNEIGFGIGFTGTSGDWVDANFDLSDYAGQTVEIAVQYLTDGGLAKQGMFVDDLQVIADDVVILSDTAENDATDKPKQLDGFYKMNGTVEKPHYYLLEWRSHEGIDRGLAHVLRSGERVEFQPGLLIWYVDDSFNDNWVGTHPGDGFLGVVDADQVPVVYNRGHKSQKMAKTVYQMRDATFSKKRQAPFSITTHAGKLIDYWLSGNPIFRDWHSFYRDDVSEAGRKLMQYGLRIEIKEQADDFSDAILRISRHQIPYAA